MKYRGKVEFLPKVCSGCLRPRQVFALTGDHQVIMPCADPVCGGSVAGEGYAAIYAGEDMQRHAFSRRAGSNGWEWFKESKSTP